MNHYCQHCGRYNGPVTSTKTEKAEEKTEYEKFRSASLRNRILLWWEGQKLNVSEWWHGKRHREDDKP